MMRTDYGPRCYRLSQAILAELRLEQWWRPVGQSIGALLMIALLVHLALRWPWLAPVCALFIAGRAGVFLQVTHEAAHKLITTEPWNARIGNWLGAYIIGLDLQGYSDGHLKHHRYANTPLEPPADAEKYKVCDPRDPALWKLFLKDLTGWTACSIRLQYLKQESGGAASGRKWLGIALWQTLLWATIFQGSLLLYLGLWILPLTTLHMVLMRIRGIAEHGLGIQLRVPNLAEAHQGDLYTRSLGTTRHRYRFIPFNWLERVLIGSLNVNYHHEHHLYPSVPYHHLPQLHALLRGQIVEHNPSVYAAGYVGALWTRGYAAA